MTTDDEMPGWDGRRRQPAQTPPEFVAVTDSMLVWLGDRLGVLLRQQTLLSDDAPGLLHDQLMAALDLRQATDDLIAVIASYAHAHGASKQSIARALRCSQEAVGFWFTEQARAIVKAIDACDGTHPEAGSLTADTHADYQWAKCAVESRSQNRTAARELMDLLLLNDTEAHRAELLPFASQQIQDAIRHGWRIEINYPDVAAQVQTEQPLPAQQGASARETPPRNRAKEPQKKKPAGVV